MKGNSYYLVHRIAGWSDKTEILELYDKEPNFNLCSESDIKPIYGDSLEGSLYLAHVYLNIEEGKLNLIYSDIYADKNRKFKLEFKGKN